MPKPDKTKLRKWDFDTFKQHHTTGDSYHQLTDLPKSDHHDVNQICIYTGIESKLKMMV